LVAHLAAISNPLSMTPSGVDAHGRIIPKAQSPETRGFANSHGALIAGPLIGGLTNGPLAARDLLLHTVHNRRPPST